MVVGSRMQHGSAQPTAAHALQGKRNARVVGCDEDNAQPAAAYALQRYEIPRPIVLFCLGDGISLTASAYRGIQSNANSADRNVTHNLLIAVVLSVATCTGQIVVILFVVFSSAKLTL